MSKRILLVEDQAMFREPLVNALGAKGYTVSSADDGVNALLALQMQSPDLMVMDITMPKLDGLTLLAKIKSDKELKSIPCIILSARSDEEFKEKAMNLGASSYLVKSQFSIKVLIDEIEKALSLDLSSIAADERNTNGSSSPSPCVIKVNLGAENNLDEDFKDSSRFSYSNFKTKCAEITPSEPTQSFIGDSHKPSPDELFLSATLDSHAELAKRVIATCNSPLFSSDSKSVDNYKQAIEHLGVEVVRGIVITIGIVDSFTNEYGVDPDLFLHWQHGLAVGVTMSALSASPSKAAIERNLIVGISHSVTDLILSKQFEQDFKRIHEESCTSGIPPLLSYRETFGVGPDQLVEMSLEGFAFPVPISSSILNYYRATENEEHSPDPTAHLLEISRSFTHSMLIRPHESCELRPVDKNEILELVGVSSAPQFDAEQFSEASRLTTCAIMQIDPSDEIAKAKPVTGKYENRTWYASSINYGVNEPLRFLLNTIVTPKLSFRLPISQELEDRYDLLIVSAPSTETDQFTLDECCELAKELGEKIKILYTVQQKGGVKQTHLPKNVELLQHPFTVGKLLSFFSE